MRRHTDHAMITAALGSLDPAPRVALTEDERDRADAVFARIVVSPSEDAIPVRPSRPHRRRRPLVVAVGLAGAVTLAVPALLLGGSAYGSWTPTPESLTPPAAATAAATCRGALDAPNQGERVEVAERRGDWTYVLLASPGKELICLMPDDLIGKDLRPGGDFFGSYDPDAPAPPTLQPDQIDENTSMEGRTDEGWFQWSEGYVGSDVAGVTVHTSSGRDIEASVSGSRFAAWWPATVQSSQHPAETWSYTVHLADGSTRDVR
jgi:hypothetical protein